MRRPRPRRGFTLLEMVLSAALAMLLLTALYWTYSSQLTAAQAGRELVAESTLARAILTRVANDIVAQLGPTDPRLATASSGGMAASPAPGADATAAMAETGTDPATVPDVPAEDGAGPTNPESFNFGVYGEANRLVLTMSRLPRELLSKRPANADAPAAGTCDLRRVTYWAAGPGGGQGLARHELTAVTGDAAATLPPDGVDVAGSIIAPEVASLSFEYFDGTGWLTSWDGTAPGPDGDTPKGPPAAIAITIELRRPGSAGDEDDPPRYRHVVAIPTANSFAEATTP